VTWREAGDARDYRPPASHLEDWQFSQDMVQSQEINVRMMIFYASIWQRIKIKGIQP